MFLKLNFSKAARQERAECFTGLVCLFSGSQAACLTHKNAGKTPSSRRCNTSCLPRDFQWGEFSYFTKMSVCCSVRLAYWELFCPAFFHSQPWCCAQKLCTKKLHVYALHCFPPFNGTLCRNGSHSQGLLLWVFFLSFFFFFQASSLTFLSIAIITESDHPVLI